MTIREQYEEYVVNYFEEAYSPHYQIEGFEFSNTELFENEVSVEATFYLKMIYKNFDKNPNTVDYIRNEKNPEIKKRLIEEYSQIQETNFGLKLLAEIDNGKLDLDTVEILASNGVVNNKYHQIDEYLPVREVYKNEEYGFTFIIPDNWEGKYNISRFYVSTFKSTLKALINIRFFEIKFSPIG